MVNELIPRIILAALFVIGVGTRKFAQRMAARTASQGIEQDRDSRGLIVLQSLLLTLSDQAMVVYLINPRWMSLSSPTLAEWARWMGAALGAAGTALLVWTHSVLGENFFGGVKIRRGHRLVTTGVIFRTIVVQGSLPRIGQSHSPKLVHWFPAIGGQSVLPRRGQGGGRTPPSEPAGCMLSIPRGREAEGEEERG